LAILKNLFPDQYLDSVYNIDYDALKNAGITNLLFDIDNTLSPFDILEPYPETVELFADLQHRGFKIGLLSNNHHVRVEAFNANLQLPCVAKARKPGKLGLSRVMKQLDAVSLNTALIGDQVFTDVWCAKRNGLLSILVRPLCERDEPLVKLKRTLEKFVIQIYLKNTDKV